MWLRLPCLLCFVLLASACATVPAAVSHGLQVSEDGTTVTAGGQTWHAPPGAAFYERGEVLHVVSLVAGTEYDVAVALGPDGRLAWPAEAPFQAEGGALAPRRSKAAASPSALPSIEDLVALDQLRRHDGHLHLTHKLELEDWQALYRDREETSPLHPMARQAAATLIALLVDERIPGEGGEVTRKAFQRVVSIIGKLRRGLDSGLPARTLEAILEHDVEVGEGGRLLTVGTRTFRAGPGLRFTWDGDHVHVESEQGTWAHPVELEEQSADGFLFPSSIFYRVRADDVVEERPSDARWRRLADAGEIRFTRDHWHLTQTYAHPGLQRLLAAMANGQLPTQTQDQARARSLDLLRLRLDVSSDEEFEARLTAIDRLIARSSAEFERELRVPAARR
jgi:hypothetical protein